VSRRALERAILVAFGVAMVAVSRAAFERAAEAKLPRFYLDFAREKRYQGRSQTFTTPAVSVLYALQEGLRMMREEGLDNVFARHQRLAEATRRAVKAWGLENLNKNAGQLSPTITAILLPEGHDADVFRELALDRFDISFGTSFGKFTGKYFRIGHLGDTNDLTILGALASVEMTLALAGVPHRKGGVQAAMDYLISAARAPSRAAAE